MIDLKTLMGMDVLELLDALLVETLKEQYTAIDPSNPMYEGEGETKMAILKVLEYNMTRDDFQKFIKEAVNEALKVKSEEHIKYP